jgi:divalent metal cation (Fe/Co/Zn/Cd) transporter
MSEAKKIVKGRGVTDFVDMAVRTKNPTVMIVLFEDTAALIGLVVAVSGISIAYYAEIPVIDAVTSIIIGIILLAVALFLARETKELLIGESATKEAREKMRETVLGVPGIEKCGRLMTMHLGPDDILVNLEVDFHDGLSTNELEAVIDRIEASIKKAVPAVKKIFIEADSIKKRIGGPKRRRN